MDYDKILSGMVNQRIDDNGDFVKVNPDYNEGGEIYDGEDFWYNALLDKDGKPSEWKENKFDWD
jgi:hypothetical protein